MRDHRADARPVRRLERLLVLTTTLVLLAAFASREEPVIRAARIELVTSGGARRAVLAADSSGLGLTLLDGRARPVSTLRLDDRSWLAVQDGQGREVAGLGSPRAHELTK